MASMAGMVAVASSQPLGPPPAAQLSCDQPADDDDGPRRQGRPHPQPGQRHAKQLQRHPCWQLRQHRLVDVAGLQMLRAGQEIELILEEAVPARHGHQNNENSAANDDDAPVKRDRKRLRRLIAQVGDARTAEMPGLVHAGVRR
jgi:hypothetical protein